MVGSFGLCLPAFPHGVNLLMYGNPGLLSRQSGETVPCLAGTLHIPFSSGGGGRGAQSVSISIKETSFRLPPPRAHS